MLRRGRPVLWCAAGLLFGVAVALLKGDGAGTREVLGNISAPWLVLPFLAGRRRQGVAAALASGAVTALASVGGFYLLDSVRYSGIVTTQVAPLILRIVVGAAIAGPVMGWFGWLSTHARSTLAGCSVGLAFLLEPAAAWLYQNQDSYSAVSDHTNIYLAEALLGAVVVGISIGRRPARFH